ncbi:MAG: ABC transporter permease [Chloroflexota bacterium]|nr:MAG: ABC transporter permease [Chloroflexota bacterium]
MDSAATESPVEYPAVRSLIDNPVTVKELRSRMRGRRAFVVLTIYLLLMSLFILLVYLVYAAAARNSFGPGGRQAGKAVFGAVLAVEMFLVLFVGPAFTSGAISGEKERRTYDLLRTTLLPARALVSGKLLSALSYVFLLIMVSVPLQSIAFLLGGVSPIEVLLSQLLVALSAVSFALIGLYFSSLMRSTLTATIATFAAAMLMTFGLPMIAGIVGSVLGSFFFGGPSPGWFAEALLIYAGLLLAATNLPATLIVSEVILLEEDALFFFSQSVGGHTVTLFSPWFVYIFIYILLALLLYWGCVRRVKRVPTK